MKKYLALDLGGTFLKAAIIDENANILEKWKIESACDSVEGLLKVFDCAVLGHLEGVEAIAISLPGRINIKEGVMETAGSFDRFARGLPIVKLLEERYHLPVGIDNDAKCAINAEIWAGALKDCENGVVYVIGTGIGGGIEINHKVYRGSHFASGELSCIFNDCQTGPSRPNEMCQLVATPALLKEYKENAGLPEEVSGEMFFDAVNAGDETALKTLKHFCFLTAMYLFNIQICLDVERIAIGGGISVQPILIEMINAEFDEIFKYRNPTVRPEIVRCEFASDANLIGAVKSYLDFH